MHQRVNALAQDTTRLNRLERTPWLAHIAATTDTYGYRCAGALVNRTRAVRSLQTINHKLFYQGIKAYQQLLPKEPKRPAVGQPHV